MTLSPKPARGRQAWFVLALFLAAQTPALAEFDSAVDVAADYNQERGAPRWQISPSPTFGYNKPGRGYKGYEKMGFAGLDLLFRPPRSNIEEPTWRDRMMFRLTGDYFPLQVPKEAYGLTEDVYSVNFGLIYKLANLHRAESRQWTPFAGAGFGSYWNTITLDTRATGKVQGTRQYWGANASAGLLLPAVFHIRLAPEVRYHTMRMPNAFWTSSLTYQVGLTLWFDFKSYD